mmetsp:Transcript_101468/g.326082  ORF Transcript_101468/g.326082 Transcript_101468/m.326082 type:complete len:301 (+) Transcript_101468:45-947(+)
MTVSSICDDVSNEYGPLLKAVASELAEVLSSRDEAPPRSAALAEALRRALLANNADAGGEAAERCQALREVLASEVRKAIHAAAVPATLRLLRQGRGLPWPLPPVRVEIRNTAGRAVKGSAFCIGSAPECEVQLAGDEAVQPVHCLVVPLPGGIVVVDLGSDEGSRMSWHRSPLAVEFAAASPSAPPERHSGAFAVAYGERTLLRFGARTTVTVGPSVTKSQGALEQRSFASIAVKKEAFEALPSSLFGSFGDSRTAQGGQEPELVTKRVSEASTSCESMFSRLLSSESHCRSRSRSASR